MAPKKPTLCVCNKVFGRHCYRLAEDALERRSNGRVRRCSLILDDYCLCRSRVRLRLPKAKRYGFRRRLRVKPADIKASGAQKFTETL